MRQSLNLLIDGFQSTVEVHVEGAPCTYDSISYPRIWTHSIGTLFSRAPGSSNDTQVSTPASVGSEIPTW